MILSLTPVALLEDFDDLARVVGHLFHHRVVQFGVKGLALRGDLLQPEFLQALQKLVERHFDAFEQRAFLARGDGALQVVDGREHRPDHFLHAVGKAVRAGGLVAAAEVLEIRLASGAADRGIHRAA